MFGLEVMALAAPSVAACLSFIFWIQKHRAEGQRELLNNFNRVENCVVELTTEVKQIQRFNEHLHGCLHEMKDRLNTLDERFYSHIIKDDEPRK